MSDPYPPDHWLLHAGPLDERSEEALRAALAFDPSSADANPGHGVTVWELPGGGHHSALGLEVDGRRYCLKRLGGADEQALGREVGGMCFLTSRGIRRAPVPCSWSSSPPYVLTDLLPGRPLGNAILTPGQLGGIAEASKELYRIKLHNQEEPLWGIDWDIEAELHALRTRCDRLAASRHREGLVQEAADLIGNWLKSADPGLFLADSDHVVFSRGDQNLANCLWDGGQIRFVDFEDCGWNDIARDLSLLTDHIQSYGTPVADWEWYIDQFGLSKQQRQRALAARRRQALSWLSIECLKPGSLHSVPKEHLLARLFERARALCGVDL
ncbi:phosphotransferase family protein [Candidatus Latescibacterota bacterium]